MDEENMNPNPDNTKPQNLDFKKGRPSADRVTVSIFGEVLRRERKHRGISGERMVELLEQAGCKMSQVTLYNIERSLVEPTPEQARVIGAVYGLKLSEFVAPERTAGGGSIEEKMFDEVLANLREQIRQTMRDGGAA